MRPFSAVIQSIKQISTHTHLISLSVLGDPLVFVPGQYIVVLIKQGDKVLRRLYSIASSSLNGKTIELFVKFVPGGVGSTHLVSSPIGTVIECMGPAGVFRLKDNGLPKVFMTTGTGFAPVRSFLHSQQTPPTSPWLLLWGDQTHQDAGFFDELKALKKQLGVFEFLYCLSRENDLQIIPADLRNYSRIGRINTVFEAIKERSVYTTAEFYLCGSRTVVEALRTYLEGCGVEKERIVFEKY